MRTNLICRNLIAVIFFNLSLLCISVKTSEITIKDGISVNVGISLKNGTHLKEDSVNQRNGEKGDKINQKNDGVYPKNDEIDGISRKNDGLRHETSRKNEEIGGGIRKNDEIIQSDRDLKDRVIDRDQPKEDENYRISLNNDMTLNEVDNNDMTLNEVDRICPDEMHHCGSGECIPRSYVCDSTTDCEDQSDEENCHSNAKSCEDAEFDCGGRCIPVKWVCDSEIDCKESKADEDPEICNHYECKADQFTCHSTGNGSSCIPLNWVCDNKKDCEDGSDEYSCNATCTSEQFTCASGKCIPLLWHCDGDNDCGDSSDELHCPLKNCSAHEAQCNNGECIMKTWFCDGEPDCKDESDEKNCPNATLPFSCPAGEIKCARTLICIQRSFLCDGDHDCPDGDDEGDPYCSGAQCPDDSFRCGDTACIPAFLRCNGFAECVDGSDELNCTATKCHPDREFDCGDRCIPASLVCNGQDDCGNGSDELEASLCSRNECEEHNGGCSQLCVDTKAGHYCACKQGFMLVDGTQCQDINECLDPGLCSQLCVNLKGSYKCECVSGYAKDPHDTHRCKAMEGHASLLFADYYDIRKISLDHQEVTAIVNETDGSTALDFVFKTGMIFWTDAKDRCIYKAPIDEGLKKEVVITKDMTNTDGLAVDWIYNHIYWTNADANTVEVADFNGDMRKTLFHRNLGEPRAIAIYPIEGWMFWTDWGVEAKIERAGMDGTHREAIVTRDIRWPNGLTVDFVLRKVYWIDSKKHTISSCNFDGGNRRVILFSKEHLPHPFSITVFEDTLYWTDWTKGAILKANKFSGNDLQIVSHAHSSPMTVHVYHSYRQPNGTNHCTPLNGLCTHLCLPAPQLNLSVSKVTCACPDGLVLMSDGLTCERPGSETSLLERYGETSLEAESALENFAMHDDPYLRNEKKYIPEMKEKEIKDSTSLFGGDQSATDGGDGSVAVAAILAAIAVLCVTSAVAYIIYRYYRKRSVHSMNFDNPVYKKTTTEDGFGMAGHQQRPAATQNGIKTSQPPYQHRQYGVMSSEDSLEPLTKNHQFV